MPAGSGDGAYLAAFERVVIPALRRFKPGLIMIAAGFDAGAFDMTGAMIVSTEGFRKIAKMLMAAADELCEGRIVLEHEGGYNPSNTPFSALAVLATVCGIRTGIDDPHYPMIKDSPDQKLQAHQDEVIRSVQAAFGL
jgi:acetoin utilization deacetylase AcuC-like enzyme